MENEQQAPINNSPLGDTSIFAAGVYVEHVDTETAPGKPIFTLSTPAGVMRFQRIGYNSYREVAAE